MLRISNKKNSDLSHNNLSGQIPMKFVNSSSLVLLNVSFNDISGSIPSKKVFKIMGKSAFVGNPKLCGKPLRHCPGTKEFRSEFELGSKRTQKLAMVLILCAVVVFFITVSVFGIFYFRRERKGQWKMVSFLGLPQFTAKDVLRSLNSIDSLEIAPPLTSSVCKAVLLTGITVSVKKIEWDVKKMKGMSEYITRIGNVRHKNLIRLLGFCYNKNLAYLLYDYLPNGNLAEKIKMKRDWGAKYKIVIGIARGLCFLHHDCYPEIAHGDLKSSNVVFDENMEPHLAEFGFKCLQQWNINGSSTAKTGEFKIALQEELYMDIHNFGELILEILTNGRLTSAAKTIHNTPMDAHLREIYHENFKVDSSNSFQEEIKLVLEVALFCTRSTPPDRPSMKDALKLLSDSKSQRK